MSVDNDVFVSVNPIAHYHLTALVDNEVGHPAALVDNYNDVQLVESSCHRSVITTDGGMTTWREQTSDDRDGSSVTPASTCDRDGVQVKTSLPALSISNAGDVLPDMMYREDVIHTDIVKGSCVSDYVENLISICPMEIRSEVHGCLGGVPNQLKPGPWRYYLDSEPDKHTADYLWKGVTRGFAIVDDDANIDSYECSNYESCLSGDSHIFIDDLIIKELLDEKYVRADVKPCCVHALGAVKKSYGTYRPITDCRRPLHKSINNYMTTTFESFNYATTDQVSELLTQGCYMATVDIASAYRSDPIRPDQWTFQGISWLLEGVRTYLYDVRLCFGLRCAPFVFTQISNFIVRVMSRLGFKNVISYIDDFIVVEPTRDRCVAGQATLFELLGSLGFEVAWKKCAAPSTQVRYLGIIFDSVDMTLSLPDDKMQKLFTELSFFDMRTRATKRQIQRLCGILAHCAKVVRGGRIFSSRVIDLLKALPEGNPRIRLTDEFHLDLQWWIEFASVFNGKQKLITENLEMGRLCTQMLVCRVTE